MTTSDFDASRTIYRITITLTGSEPPIRRQVEVENCSLELLHNVIQDAMGWCNYHLYEFRIKGQAYSNPLTLEDDQLSAAEVTLADLVAQQCKQFEYEYDFSDNWQHTVELQEAGTADPAVHYPRCAGGSRACPPEDCGGIEKYARYLKALDDPDDPAFEDALDLLGDLHDPSKFDVQSVNERWATWNFNDPDSGPTFEEEAAQPEPPRKNNVSKPAAKTPSTERSPQVGRNDPCPCGSGKKYKKCCFKRGEDDDFDE